MSTLTGAVRTRRRIRGAFVQGHPGKGRQHRHQLTMDSDLFHVDECVGRSRRHLAVTLGLLVVLLPARLVAMLIVRVLDVG